MCVPNLFARVGSRASAGAFASAVAAAAADWASRSRTAGVELRRHVQGSLPWHELGGQLDFVAGSGVVAIPGGLASPC